MFSRWKRSLRDNALLQTSELPPAPARKRLPFGAIAATSVHRAALRKGMKICSSRRNGYG